MALSTSAKQENAIDMEKLLNQTPHQTEIHMIKNTFGRPPMDYLLRFSFQLSTPIFLGQLSSTHSGPNYTSETFLYARTQQ